MRPLDDARERAREEVAVLKVRLAQSAEEYEEIRDALADALTALDKAKERCSRQFDIPFVSPKKKIGLALAYLIFLSVGALCYAFTFWKFAYDYMDSETQQFFGLSGWLPQNETFSDNKPPLLFGRGSQIILGGMVGLTVLANTIRSDKSIKDKEIQEEQLKCVIHTFPLHTPWTRRFNKAKFCVYLANPDCFKLGIERCLSIKYIFLDFVVALGTYLALSQVALLFWYPAHWMPVRASPRIIFVFMIRCEVLIFCAISSLWPSILIRDINQARMMAKFVKQIRNHCASGSNDLEKMKEKNENGRMQLVWWIEQILLEEEDTEEDAERRMELTTRPIIESIRW